MAAEQRQSRRAGQPRQDLADQSLKPPIGQAIGQLGGMGLGEFVSVAGRCLVVVLGGFSNGIGEKMEEFEFFIITEFYLRNERYCEI